MAAQGFRLAYNLQAIAAETEFCNVRRGENERSESLQEFKINRLP